MLFQKIYMLSLLGGGVGGSKTKDFIEIYEAIVILILELPGGGGG